MKAVRSRGIGILALSALLFGSQSAFCQPGLPRPETSFVDVQGHKMHVQVAGMEKRKPGQPVVVFENGLGGTLDAWSLVIPQVARFAPAIAYERAGIGQSESDGHTPTPRYISEKLHSLLKQIDIAPPYVLVGWSLGGPLIRMFEGTYPDEVAGLVYVDPMIPSSKAEDLVLFESFGSGPEGQKAFTELEDLLFQEVSSGVKAERKMAQAMGEDRSEEYETLGPLPDIPVITLMATKYEWAGLEKVRQLPFDLEKFFDAWTRQRLEKLPRMTREVSEGTFIMTGNSGHGISYDEPDLLVWAIARAVFPDIGRQIRRAIDQKGLMAGVESYKRLKESYPPERFNVNLLNNVGNELIGGGKVAEAVSLFELNVKEYPVLWEAYDFLGLGYMVQGNKEKAIATYRKSLELNPHNQNAIDQIKQLDKK